MYDIEDFVTIFPRKRHFSLKEETFRCLVGKEPEWPEDLEAILLVDCFLETLLNLPKTVVRVELVRTRIGSLSTWTKALISLPKGVQTFLCSNSCDLFTMPLHMIKLPNGLRNLRLNGSYRHQSELKKLPILPASLYTLECFYNKIEELNPLPPNLKILDASGTVYPLFLQR